MNKYILYLSVLLITFANVKISTKLFDRKNIQLKILTQENIELKNKLDKYETGGISVTVTMYQPTRYQTDSTPTILADGTRIRADKASNYKFIAVSRNLLKRFGGWLEYGDFVLLKGTKIKDGIYQVRDTMNPRFVNYIDILESLDVKPYKFDDAKIVKANFFIGK